MADEIILTFGTDLSKVRADVSGFVSEIQGRPVALPFASGGQVGRGPAGAPPAIANPMGFMPSPYFGGSATGSSGASSGNINQAATNLVSAMNAAAGQIRAAAGRIGGGGPGGPGGRGPGGGGGDEGGEGPGAFSSGRRMMSMLRGGLYTLGVIEGYHAYRGQRLADANAQFAETSTERIDAQLQGLHALTSGPFGSVIGMGADVLDWATGGKVVGPTSIEEKAIEAKAMIRASAAMRRQTLALQTGMNTRNYGSGKYGRGAAGIENRYLEAKDQFDETGRNASAMGGTVGGYFQLVASMMQVGAGLQRSYEMGQLRLDYQDELAEFGDRGSVARGTMTRGAARLAAIRRRNARYSTTEDRMAGEAEYGAASAEEGYRVWQAEYGATAGRDQAYFRYNRKPNVADAIGIYTSGIRESEEAMRNSSPTTAQLIRERTAYELAGFKRSLLDSGSASYVENGLAVDFGQGGPGGRESNNVGDDLLEAVNKANEYLQVLPQILEAL